MRSLLGRRRGGYSRAVGEAEKADESESADAPRSSGPSLGERAETVLFYAALLIVGALAGNAFLDILDHAHFMKSPREHHAVAPAEGPPAASAPQARLAEPGMAPSKQRRVEALSKPPQRHQSLYLEVPQQPEPRVASAALPAGVLGGAGSLGPRGWGLAAKKPLLSIRRLEVLAVTPTGDQDAVRLSQKFKTSVTGYRATVRQEAAQLLFRVMPSEVENRMALEVAVNGEALKPEGRALSGPMKGDGFLVSSPVALGPKGTITDFTISLSASGDEQDYSLSVFRREDSLKHDPGDAQLALINTKVPGETKKAVLSPEFSPGVFHYDFNVSEHRTKLHVVAIATATSSEQEYKEQAARMTMSSVSAGAGSDTAFLVFAASDSGAAVTVNGVLTKVGTKLTRHRFPVRNLVIGANMMSIEVRSVDGSSTELYTVVINRQPADISKRISAVIKARQEEIAKFLPSDNRAKADGIVNINIRRMVERCRNSPDPWVPLLGKLPTQQSKESARQSIKSQVDDLIERAKSFTAIEIGDRFKQKAGEDGDEQGQEEDALLKQLVSRVAGAQRNTAEGVAGAGDESRTQQGEVEEVHPEAKEAEEQAAEGDSDTESDGKEAAGGKDDPEKEEEDEEDHRFDDEVQVAGQEQAGGMQEEEPEDGGDVDEGGNADKGGEEADGGADEEGGRAMDKDKEVGGGAMDEDKEEGDGAMDEDEEEDGGAMDEDKEEDGGAMDENKEEDGGAMDENKEEDGGAMDENKEEDGEPAEEDEVALEGEEELGEGEEAVQEQAAEDNGYDESEDASAEVERVEADTSQGWEDTKGNPVPPAEEPGAAKPADEEAGKSVLEGAAENAAVAGMDEEPEEEEAAADGDDGQEEAAAVAEEARRRRLASLVPASGGAKSRYLSRQRARAAARPSHDREFAEALMRPSKYTYKEFSFMDDSVHTVKRRTEPQPPPQAAAAGLPRPAGLTRALPLAIQPPNPRPEKEPEGPSKEMVKSYQGVAKAVGVFTPDGMAKNLKGVEKQLSACFRYLEKCEIPPETVAANMQRLEGFQRLSKNVICPAAHVGGTCGKLSGNPEYAGPALDKSASEAPPFLAPLEPKDGKERYASCAVVGNSRTITHSDFHGEAINSHDAVFRVNLAPTRLYEPYVGNKTTYRVLDADTLKALARSGWRMPDGVSMPKHGEGWVVWNYDALAPASGAKAAPGRASAKLGSSLIGRLYDQMQMTGMSVHLLSPEMLKWQVDAYFGFMAEIVRLGLAPKIGGGTGWGFAQPAAMSTGMHAALLATQVCDEVNLFGFTSNPKADPAEVEHGSPATDRYFDSTGAASGDSRGIDWKRREYEAWMLQMLHMTSRAALCTH